jgi:hypothetical protein
MENMSLNWKALAFLLLAFLITFLIVFNRRRRKKAELAEYYGITKPTLAKWVELIPCGIPIEEWKTKKDLSFEEFETIKRHWGDDSSLVLTKAKIAEDSSSNYKTVAANVKLNLGKIGISLKAWKSLNSFPPTTSTRILGMLG